MKVEQSNNHYIMKGYGCPLAAPMGHHPTVCLAIESLVATLLDATVQQCCDRTRRPQSCFQMPRVDSGR